MCVELARYSEFHKFHDQTQEHDTEKCKDRIRVYPWVALHCDQHQHKGNAMQCRALVSYCEPDLTLVIKTRL